MKPVTRSFTILLSLFLLIEGIWGLFSDVVFAIFTTNKLHAVIHIALAIAGLWSAAYLHSKTFLSYVGTLLLVVGILRFIPVTKSYIINILNVNDVVGGFNIIAGILCLLFAYAYGQPKEPNVTVTRKPI